MLGVGTLVSLFTAVLATQAILAHAARHAAARAAARRSARAREAQASRFDFMGASKWFFSMSGVILLIGALAIGGKGLNFGIDFESGTRITAPLEQPADERATCATRSAERARRREDPDRRRPGARRERRPDLDRARSRRRTSTRSATRSTTSFGLADDPNVETIGPTFGETVANTALDRDHRVADRDLDLHRAALRVEVRRAGADRADARPPDHGGRLLAHRPGGDDVDGRGAADHPRLLALRHDHRVRPHPRERAAHAARGVLADRQPLDVRGPHALAGDVVLHAAAGARADALRRRDAARTSPSRCSSASLSGTYSSIFIAGPVLTHWKEREPVYRTRERRIMRRARLRAGLRGRRRAARRSTSRRPSARRGRRVDHRAAGPDAGLAARSSTRWCATSTIEERAPAREHRRAARPPGGRPPRARRRRPRPAAPAARASRRGRAATGGDAGDGETPKPQEAAQPQAREAALMGMLAWVMMGLAIWHFTIFLPDRFWGGIVGAFLGALIGAVLFGLLVNGFTVPGQDDTTLVDRARGDPGRADRHRRRLLRRRAPRQRRRRRRRPSAASARARTRARCGTAAARRSPR